MRHARCSERAGVLCREGGAAGQSTFAADAGIETSCDAPAAASSRQAAIAFVDFHSIATSTAHAAGALMRSHQHDSFSGYGGFSSPGGGGTPAPPPPPRPPPPPAGPPGPAPPPPLPP